MGVLNPLARTSQILSESSEAPGPRLAADQFTLDLLLAAQSRQEPAQNAISKLCLHPTSPKSDFEHPSWENAMFLLTQAAPKSPPKRKVLTILFADLFAWIPLRRLNLSQPAPLTSFRTRSKTILAAV